MNEVRQAHFAQSRRLIEEFSGCEIKITGDNFMAAFRNNHAALDDVRSLQKLTGHPKVRIGAHVHMGSIKIDENDEFGGAVNYVTRVAGAIKDAEIWLSDRAKEDIGRFGSAKHNELKWRQHENLTMKGFPGRWMLWELQGKS